MGHEMIGEIAEGGDGVFKTGQRVIVDPAFTAAGACNAAPGKPAFVPTVRSWGATPTADSPITWSLR